jgi:hypothetical protein
MQGRACITTHFIDGAALAAPPSSHARVHSARTTRPGSYRAVSALILHKLRHGRTAASRLTGAGRAPTWLRPQGRRPLRDWVQTSRQSKPLPVFNHTQQRCAAGWRLPREQGQTQRAHKAKCCPRPLHLSCLPACPACRHSTRARAGHLHLHLQLSSCSGPQHVTHGVPREPTAPVPLRQPPGRVGKQQRQDTMRGAPRLRSHLYRSIAPAL